LETITHFNSIAKKITQEGFEPIIVVDKCPISIRNDDYLLRLRGEEFVVFVATHSLKQAKRASEHLRSMIEYHTFKEIGKLTCSFGVTLHQYD
jgi:GGDEF domain-containing protein